MKPRRWFSEEPTTPDESWCEWALKDSWRDWAMAAALLAGSSCAILSRWMNEDPITSPGLIWQDYFAFLLAALAVTVAGVAVWKWRRR